MSYKQPPRKPFLVLATLALLAVLGWRFPLFHVVPLARAEKQQQAAALDAAKVATEFWEAKLIPATDRAVEAKELLAALAEDAAAARKRYGRMLGISTRTLFFIKGTGRVTEVRAEAVIVELDGTGEKVGLSTGLLFGNTVRDATGLLDVSAYANSQDFNDLSALLNGIVESKIAKALRETAAVGKAIRFAGCVELDEDEKPEILPVIPVRIVFP